MRQNGITPSSLIELATAYWGSATLIAAIRLKVFDHLDNGPQTADALSSKLQSDPIATEALLEGCVSLDLLHHDENGFRNTAQSSVFLVNGKPSCIATGLLYNGDVYPLWNQLDSVVKDGAPKHSPEAYLGEDAERTANFVYGMHHRALGVGQAVASTIDLSGCRHLADVGGGPGTYAALLTKAHPELKATVLDLEPVVDIARDIVESMNASSRVECVAFDYYKDALPGTYDAALISGVLHREQPDGVRRIFQKVSDALMPGGVLYISDVMVNDERTGPVFSTMFALNMRVLAHDGRSHSVAEQAQWLSEAGFANISHQRLSPPINYTIIKAEKR